MRKIKVCHLIVYVVMTLMFIVATKIAFPTDVSVSYSARSCAIRTLPFDYEVRAAVEGKNCEADLLYEREVGIQGVGADIYWKDPFALKLNALALKTDIGWYMREVKEMNYQYLTIRAPYKRGKLKCLLGFSINTVEQVQNARVLLSFNIKYKKILKANLETNFIDRRVYKLKASNKMYIKGSKYFIEPLLEIKQLNTKSFWWTKLSLGVSL